MESEDFSKIINWNNVFEQSNSFKNSKPFSFGFIEDFFTDKFYNNLYETFPKIDEKWNIASVMSKYQHYRTWNNASINDPHKSGDDPSLSEYFNKLKRYAETEEFVSNFREFSGVPVSKLKTITFMSYEKGGFQYPHIHNNGPSSLIIMLYFSKGWKKGDPGGTYMASEEDESKIIFEPYNLNNSIALFHDGPMAAHGVRYITKDVTRQGMQIILEGFNEDTERWSSDK
jgi:hypothetical protein